MLRYSESRGKNMRLQILIIALLAYVAFGSICCADTIEPLAMTNAAIGGGELNAYTPGVEGGTGLNNIGLLIKTWGQVTFVNDVIVTEADKYFYIDDGTGRLDGSGHTGIRCSYGELASGAPAVTVPTVGTYKFVTGVISTVLISSKIQPNLRARGGTDII
jgi:hypothetical protein